MRRIAFSRPMVGPVRAGLKTQTRRIIRDDWWRCLDPDDEADRATALAQSPFGKPGDLLIGCEALRRHCPQKRSWPGWVVYDVDRTYAFDYSKPEHRRDVRWPWKLDVLPSRFMPTWASRITLEIAGLRLERLQCISEADCEAELGHEHCSLGNGAYPRFAHAWEAINGRDSWAANPWVWVVEFKLAERATVAA